MRPVETFIILKEKRMHSGYIDRTRYAVGAKDEKQALELLRDKIGKLCKIRVYYKEQVSFMKYKEVGIFEGELYSNGKLKYKIL